MLTSPLQLQEHPNFGYKFNHITLLYEALTHSFQNSERFLANGNICYKKKTFYRLKTLGCSVLKLLCSELAIRIHKMTVGPGVLTDCVKALQSDNFLTVIGQELDLHRFIEIQNEYSKNKVEKLYPDVVKAIVGAVYVDSQSSQSLQNVYLFLCVFYAKVMLVPVTTMDFYLATHFSLHNEYVFPRQNYGIVGNFCRVKNPAALQGSIGYDFKQELHLQQALFHGSVKQVEKFKFFADYQRMEFLGDAVWELVLCEYLFWYFVNDEKGEYFHHINLTQFTDKKFQKVVAEHLSLSQYMYMLKPDTVDVQNTHEFLESVIGAVYIDSHSSIPKAREVIINLCNVCAANLIKSECAQVPFAIRTYYTTECQLTNGVPIECKTIPELKPPVITNQFTIKDPEVFKYAWQQVTYSANQHNLQLSSSLREATKSPEKLTMSLDLCNRSEYFRLSLYGLVAEYSVGLEFGIKPEYLLFMQKMRSSRSPNVPETVAQSEPPIIYNYPWVTSEVTTRQALSAVKTLSKYTLQRSVATGKILISVTKIIVMQLVKLLGQVALFFVLWGILLEILWKYEIIKRPD